MSRGTVVKAVLLVGLALAAVVLVQSGAVPGVVELRERVRSTGAAGWVAFVVGYALLVLVPSPASAFTIAGGALFGLWTGALLVLAGALAGAVAAFEIGRFLGRDAVSRLTHGRLRQVDRLLRDHGLTSVVAVRLVPLVPFVALNYAAGLSGVRRRDYVLGTALGIVPGTFAYAAVGAYGTDPLGLVAALGALVLLVLGGSAWGRRLLARQQPATIDGQEPPTTDDQVADGPAGPQLSGAAKERRRP